jgi:hypothetical protein
MARIKLDADKLVGYMRTDLTETGIAKLGTAKLGCQESGSPAKTPTTKRLPATRDHRA